MSQVVRLVHISDLHARVSQKEQITLRVNAFLNDLAKLNQPIDAILFTGDLAFSGKPEEYELAERLLLTPLRRRFKIPKEKMFFIPGNHDVDRDCIDPFTEDGITRRLNTVEDAEAILEHPQHSLKRLENYSNFIQGFLKEDPAIFRVKKLNAAGLTFGFACLNSAWRCSGSSDAGHLFLTAKQVLPALEELKDCHFKVGLIHHPFDWLHPAELGESVADLKNGLDLVVTGHLHVPLSQREVTPQSDSLMLSAPAMSENRADVVGYNIYEVSYGEKTLTAHYRKFVRIGTRFDKDTLHAPDGQYTFRIASNDLTLFAQGALCQRITEVGTAIDSVFKKNLREFQETDDPIYVTPAVQRVEWKGAMPVHTPLPDIMPILDTNALIHGPREVGKTILLQALASSTNAAASTNGGSRVAVYVNFDRARKIDIKKKIRAALTETLAGLQDIPPPAEIIFCVDHLADGDAPLEEFTMLAADNPGWRFIVSTDNHLQLDAAAARQDLADWSFYRIAHWGPGRIREFVKIFFSKEDCEIDVAYEFIRNSLRDTDLPATPMVVILYLSVFQLVGEERTSLSFLHLLQTVESHRLSHSDNSSTDALYNKKRILAILAAECAAQGVTALPTSHVEKIVTDFFGKLLLEVRADKFIQGLVVAGILKYVDDEIAFTRYIFLEYYLATAFDKGIAEFSQHTDTLFEAIEVSNALALYGGLVRDNNALPHRLMDLIGQYSSPKSDFTLSDLDAYIQDVLLPHDLSEVAEKIATADIQTRVDYHDQDDDFARDKEQYERNRRDISRMKAPATDAERLGLVIYGLKAFYNVFRNMENLAGDDKVLLLDRILDFHIQLNLEAIHFYCTLIENGDFQTVFAYLFTLGGQHFLSTNIGSQSLKRTIEEALHLCGGNDFKELLLRVLYADLRLPEHEKKLAAFAEKTKSRAAVEIIYLKLRELMIKHEKDTIPVELVSAFRTVYAKRLMVNDQKTHKDQPRESRAVIDTRVEAQVQQIRQQHFMELAALGQDNLKLLNKEHKA